MTFIEDKVEELMGIVMESTGTQEIATGDIKEALTTTLKEATEPDMVRVGMLRQWLNEDRITDPEKMVTNEDIISWLSNTPHHE